ncbi:MAG: hypothetical protein EBW68_08870, partial [Actinobacteria bacterium]|nr:hypothetical protein [Actinomycetota bacterium]
MKLRITSTQNFLVFLKRLKSVEKSVILELTKDSLFSKVHTADKSVMKYTSILLSDVMEGDVDWAKLKTDRVKIGILDATRLMEAFKHFRPEEDVYLELTTDNVDGDCVSTEIKLISASLNIRLRCADLGLLSYVEDKILSMVHSQEDAVAQFKIYQSDFTTILSLCGMETNSEEVLAFEINEKNAHSFGDSFRYKLNLGASEITTSESVISNIYKGQLS